MTVHLTMSAIFELFFQSIVDVRALYSEKPFFYGD